MEAELIKVGELMRTYVNILLVLTIGLLMIGGTARADAAVKLRIGYPSGMNGQIVVVMEKTGIAKKYGINAEYTFFQNGPPMMQALTAGSIDAVITSLMPVTSYFSKQPGKAEIVAQLGASSYSLMVPKGSDITNIKALRRKRIAVSFGTDSELDLLRSLSSVGLVPPKDVKLLNMPPDQLPLALRQGLADAIVIRQPQVLRMQEQFSAKIVKTWPFRFVVIIRSDYLRKYPQLKNKFIAVLKDAVYYAATHKEQASVWFGERLRLDPKIVQRVTADDPIYQGVKRPEDVSVEITPGFRSIINKWFANSYKFGMIKTKVKPLTVGP